MFSDGSWIHDVLSMPAGADNVYFENFCYEILSVFERCALHEARARTSNSKYVYGLP